LEKLNMDDDAESRPRPVQGETAYLKVTMGGPTAFSDAKGRRLVQVSIFQPFAPTFVALVREDAIVAAPPETHQAFSDD
jgi:hypothetical protein